MCDCDVRWREQFKRRRITKLLQMCLPFEGNGLSFSSVPPYIPKLQPHRDMTLWNRQPAKFPRKWWRLADGNPNWRSDYQLRWSERRRAQGLPDVVHDPAPRVPMVPKKPSVAEKPPLEIHIPYRLEGKVRATQFLDSSETMRRISA